MPTPNTNNNNTSTSAAATQHRRNGKPAVPVSRGGASSAFQRLGLPLLVDVHLTLLAVSPRDAPRLRVAAPVPLLHDPPSVAFSDSAVRLSDAFDAAARELLRGDVQWEAPPTGAGCITIAHADGSCRDARADYSPGLGHARAWQPSQAAASDAAIAVVFGPWDASLMRPLARSFTAISVDLSRCTGLTTVPADFAAACPSLRRVTLPTSVTTIGEAAFENATSLEELDLSHCTGLTSIPDYFAAGCAALCRVLLPASISTIGSSAFEGAASLPRLVLPASVATIGEGAFKNAVSLEELDVSHCSGLTIIPAECVQGCVALRRVLLPTSVTQIGRASFKNATRLAELDLSPCTALVRIGNHACAGCTALHGASLPKGVRAIGWGAFEQATPVVELDASRTVVAVYQYDAGGLRRVLYEQSSHDEELPTPFLPAAIRRG